MRAGAIRMAVGVAVVVSWCAFRELSVTRGNLWVFHDAMRGELHDSIAINQERFTGIRRDLPADRAVGYVSNQSRDPEKDLFLTALVQVQSALAPHLVLDTRALSPLVGYFPDTPPDTTQLAAEGLHVRHDYGNGVLLLTRSTP